MPLFDNDPLDGPHLFLRGADGACALCGSVVSWDPAVHADLSGEGLSFLTTDGEIDLAIGQTRQNAEGQKRTLVGMTATQKAIVWDRGAVWLVDPGPFRRLFPAVVLVRWQDRKDE